jgi:hypothetical protein
LLYCDLKIYTNFSNLLNYFLPKAISHRWFMWMFMFCRRLVESDIIVTPSVNCMDWLHWWYNHAAHLVSSSTALVFLNNLNEKSKSTSPCGIQVWIWWKTIGTEEKFDPINRLKKGEWSVTYTVILCLLTVTYIQFV